MAAKDPEFLLLKPRLGWLPETVWPRLLGSAVKNYLSPLQDSVPDDPRPYTKSSLIEDTFERFILKKVHTAKSSKGLEVKGLGLLRGGKTTVEDFSLDGKVIYTKRLKQHTAFWNEITNKDTIFNATVRGWLTETNLLRPKYEVCLVVGVLLCQDVVVTASDEEADERVLRNETELGAINPNTSTSSIGKVTGDMSKKTDDKAYFKAEGRGMKVFALELRRINLKKGQLALSDKTPKFDRKLGGGQEAEHLSLGDIDEDVWAQLVDEVEHGDVEATAASNS